MLIHNGHISNADSLFRAVGLRRETRVDSEILLRMAEKNLSISGMEPLGFVDDISEFMMNPIDRKTRQAVTRRIAVDSQGRESSRALMTRDGLLFHSGATADLYEDEDGNAVEHVEVIAVDGNGNALRNLSSTIGRPQRPIGPVPVEEPLENVVTKACALMPVVIARDLRDSLASADIYKVAFRSRASVVDNPAFILVNASGIFLLQCKPCLVEFIRLDQAVVLEDEMDAEDDLWEDDWQTINSIDAGGDEW